MDIFSPPTRDFTADPDTNREAIADLNSYSGDPGPYMTGQPNSGNKQAALAYMDSARQMMEAAVNEDPRLGPIIQRVSMVIGMGMQTLESGVSPMNPPQEASEEPIVEDKPEDIPLNI